MKLSVNLFRFRYNFADFVDHLSESGEDFKHVITTQTVTAQVGPTKKIGRLISPDAVNPVLSGMNPDIIHFKDFVPSPEDLTLAKSRVYRNRGRVLVMEKEIYKADVF